MISIFQMVVPATIDLCDLSDIQPNSILNIILLSQFGRVESGRWIRPFYSSKVACATCLIWQRSGKRDRLHISVSYLRNCIVVVSSTNHRFAYFCDYIIVLKVLWDVVFCIFSQNRNLTSSNSTPFITSFTTFYES